MLPSRPPPCLPIHQSNRPPLPSHLDLQIQAMNHQIPTSHYPRNLPQPPSLLSPASSTSAPCRSKPVGHPTFHLDFIVIDLGAVAGGLHVWKEHAALLDHRAGGLVTSTGGPQRVVLGCSLYLDGVRSIDATPRNHHAPPTFCSPTPTRQQATYSLTILASSMTSGRTRLTIVYDHYRSSIDAIRT